MTYLDFVCMCCEAGVLPSVAFEQEEVAQAFRQGDTQKVQELLREKF